MGDSDRNYRRSKPQQQLYKPGSGPLRKSDRQGDDYGVQDRGFINPSRRRELDQIAEVLKNIDLHSHENTANPPREARKERRPDNALYVPRPLLEATGKKFDTRPSLSNASNVENNILNSSYTGHDDRVNDSVKTNSERRSKRSGGKKKNSRRGGGDRRGDNQMQASRSEFGQSVESLSERLVDNTDRISNPPPPVENYQRRDARESDHRERGRGPPRNGLPERFDNLPPRLKKKYLEDMGCEENMWDGHSLTFQKGKQGRRRDDDVPNDLLHRDWTSAPPPAARGRGRLRGPSSGQSSRSLTPERVIPQPLMQAEPMLKPPELIRPSPPAPSPPPAKEPPSPPPPAAPVPAEKTVKVEEKKAEAAVLQPLSSNFVLDWAAEVEKCEELESQDDEPPFQFAVPAAVAPPPQVSRPPPLLPNLQSLLPHPHANTHQSSHPTRLRRNRKRSGSPGRRNSGDVCSSRGSSVERGRCGAPIEGSWRRDTSRNSSPDHSRGDAWNRRSRNNSERSSGGGGGSGRRRRSSERSGGGGGGRRRRSSERSGIRGDPCSTNWRLEQRSFSRDREDSRQQSGAVPSKPQGIIYLPQQPLPQPAQPQGIIYLPQQPLPQPAQPRRSLYNPNDPDKPIAVVSPSRAAPLHDENSYTYHPTSDPPHFVNNMGEHITAGQPLFYRNYHQLPKASLGRLVKSMEKADGELQYLVSSCDVMKNWERIATVRSFLKESLKKLLQKELKFCETENVEQHYWRILYYNIIELLRKFMGEHPDRKSYRELVLEIIDEGTLFFESVIETLEGSYNIKFESVNTSVQELSGYSGLSTISAQKVFLFLGDLARYKQQINDTCDYGQARQWYLKANQMNPKNGRPYNQLALLAVYTGRKVEAVYYYMRTLASSSPLPSAKERLDSLFDENMKKYMVEEKRKKEERAARERERMREKEGGFGSGLRREVWVHPAGGRNLHRTTASALPSQLDSDDDRLTTFSPAQLNKMFSMSYLQVIGKLFTKIGLETLNDTSIQMLKEFRALLFHSPLQLNATRFIQVISLNMFALEITQPKNKDVDADYRATLQESALIVALQMFNMILERFIALIGSTHISNPEDLPPDCLTLLPCIKVWCDWLITHVEVWNPPPTCQDFSAGLSGDCWERLATLVNLMGRMEDSCNSLVLEKYEEGHELICLPENATLGGFLPLMANCEEPAYVPTGTPLERAQTCLRIQRLLFFGTVFLCGLDPPVIKLQKLETGNFEYISIVETTSSREMGKVTPKAENKVQTDTEEVLVESESGESNSAARETDGDSGKAESDDDAPPELKSLIRTRQRLESLARSRQSRLSQRQRLIKEQEIVVEIEIRPRQLIPDTNCFIDYLDLINLILETHSQHSYVIMVPLTVVNELEGLSGGCKPGGPVVHAAQVREGARTALQLLGTRHPALKPITTCGHILASTLFKFEADDGQEMKNDDKILTTCINLCHQKGKEVLEGGKRKLYREVVLLTDDRNLRVKALSRDVPVRDLPDFMVWANLVP